MSGREGVGGTVIGMGVMASRLSVQYIHTCSGGKLTGVVGWCDGGERGPLMRWLVVM